MKKPLLGFILLCGFIHSSFAQSIPTGMNYQAVARNLKGEIMANESITLKINLVSNHGQERKSYFSEIHTITTNELGLFSLIIGEGNQEQGTFNDVPWSTENIWMEVAIKDKTQTVFSTISNSKLFAVPYAMHAVTANTLVGDNTPSKDQSQGKLSSLLPTPGVISTNWSVLGNAKTDASGNIYRLNSLGTTDFVDLFLITNNEERMRITAQGDIKIKNGFEIGKSVLLNSISGNTIVNGSFTVEKMSPARFTGTLNVDKGTKLNDSLTVDKMAPTRLTGTLVVDKSTRLNDSLTVNNMKPTYLTGNLTVDKTTKINDSLIVTGMKPTILTGSLTVEKDVIFKSRVNIGAALSLKDSFIIQNMSPAILTGKIVVDKSTTLKDSLTVTNMKPTYLTGSLTVDKTTRLNDSLIVTNMKPTALSGTLTVDKSVLIKDTLKVIKNDTGFVAYFENTNNAQGDGIRIKLGKTHPAWNGSFIETPNVFANELQPYTDKVKGWLIDHTAFSVNDLLNINTGGTLYAAAVCSIENFMINQLNSLLNLPIKIPTTYPILTPQLDNLIPVGSSLEYFLGLGYGLPNVDIDFPDLPKIDIDHFDFPDIPALVPTIPTISCTAPSLSVPNIAFTNVPNSLSNDNHFIRFVDKDNRQLGAIRAVSVTDWQSNFLDNTYLINVAAGLVGLDAAQKVGNAIASFTSIADDYNKLGVEYMSGHADYAEWLERMDQNEFITSGDIVGVKGGKISKHLKDAEQILAVSSNPIVLGNAPAPESESRGNKIAFMGQVPVKVMGSVQIGDYIVAKGEVAGYGMAMHPNVLTMDDLKLVIGRAWESNAQEGPKFINTLIGVDNGDFIKIMKSNQDKINEMELRLKLLDQKMKQLINHYQGRGIDDDITNKK